MNSTGTPLPTGRQLPTGRPLPFGMPRDVGILAVTTFIWGLGEGLFIFFYPLSLQRWQMDSVQIGAVLSLLGIIMAVVQAPAGYLSDRFGTRPLIRAALILGVIAAGMMAAANSLPFFVAGLIVYSITSFIVAPLNSYITHMRGSWSAQRGIILCLRFPAGRRNCWTHVGWAGLRKQPGWRWFSAIPPGSFSSRP